MQSCQVMNRIILKCPHLITSQIHEQINILRLGHINLQLQWLIN